MEKRKLTPSDLWIVVDCYARLLGMMEHGSPYRYLAGDLFLAPIMHYVNPKGHLVLTYLTREGVKKMGLSWDEIIDQALLNMEQELPASITAARGMKEDDPEGPDILLSVTNKTPLVGATALFYPKTKEALQQISEEMLVVPYSDENMLLFPWQDNIVDLYTHMTDENGEPYTPEYAISDILYHFNTRTGELRPADEVVAERR